MKISCNWLKDYIPVELDPVEIARILTDCGLEVEAIEPYESLKGGLNGVVIGHVISTSRHPNADKLTCCKVEIGEGQVLDIVCGAPNVAAGQKVPVATVGTIIYKGEESFTIKASKIRGEQSEGMICAEDELGLGDSHAGIMVLANDAKPGMQAADYFKITRDTILEVAITPNRADAASFFGVARDLAAALKIREKQHPYSPFKKPDLDWEKAFAQRTSDLPITVTVENPEACRRYSGITLKGIKVKESPQWLQERLKSVGLRPINNIVDITNYVLFETGQPLHAFDADAVTGNQVIVRKLEAGTRFVTLDGIERNLGADDLMICNANEGMCIGGVFGGIKSGVTMETTSIFLESACFDAVHIRKTSKLHGLKTDASFRFERGTDPNMTVYAMKRAVLLMLDMAGGSIASEIIDIYPQPVENRIINVNLPRMIRLIGKAIEKDTIIDILNALEVQVKEESEDGLVVSVPPFKVDVEREADVTEEVLRIYGYNNIEMPMAVHSSLSFSPKPDPERIQNMVSDFLSNSGFNEILTNSLTKADYYEKSEVFPILQSVHILNPLSRDLSVMRQTLLFSGLESLVYNLNRRQLSLKFYEFGTVYRMNPAQAESSDVTKKYNERLMLAMFVTGNQENESWYTSERKSDHAYLKSHVFALLRKAGIPLWKLQPIESDPRIYSSAESFSINQKPFMTIGKLNASLLKSFEIKQEVFYAEIEWLTLLSLLKPDVLKFKDVPRFPEVRRDLSLLLDTRIRFADLEAVAYKAGKGLLQAVNLFDVYEGDKIEQGKKSYALSFILQDEGKTLTDGEVEKMMSRIADAFEKELGAQVRK